ncbi:MAG: serine hydrolase [Erysipelotrichaceae bacterium]
MKFKKLILYIFIFGISFSITKADSFVVISGDDTVLEEKDMHNKQSVASISKIMTAIVAIENGTLDKKVIVNKEATQVEGSSLYLKDKQTYSYKELLYGLMLRSGNDAAYLIANNSNLDYRSFINEMNVTAKRIGMINSTFNNESGLDINGGNISTAYDMAILMNYAMKNPIFKEICGTKLYDNTYKQRWKNKNKLLFNDKRIIAGKTGYTRLAGRTLVSYASNDDLELIIVSLNKLDDFEFHQSTYNLNFDQYKSIVVLDVGEYKYNNYYFKVLEPIKVTIKKDNSSKVTCSYKIEGNSLVLNVDNGIKTNVHTFPLNKAKML